jgi:enoyl-CoA hydratase
MTAEKSQTQIEVRKANGVATVEFNSEEGVNIFSSRVIGVLDTLIDRIAVDPHVRYVVFRGTGKVFLAGADIAEMSGFDDDRGMVFAKNGHAVFDAIEGLPQVTFAALNGHAMGGGCELALACDFRIMAAKGKIGQPESKLGIIPGWGGTQRLTRYVPLGWARRLLFSGEVISAEQAQQIGLVDEVVDDVEALDAALETWFKRLAPGAPAAIKRIKRALTTGDEVGEFAKCFLCEEAAEGMAAFREKRAASWSEWKGGG